MMKFLAPYEPQLRSLLRIMAAFTFSLHGWQKFFGAFGGIGGHKMPIDTMLGMAGVLETFGGALIILGLFTRPVAFILSGFMAAAYFMAHFPMSFFPALNFGEPAVLYCFIFLYLAAAGPGPWALDKS